MREKKQVNVNQDILREAQAIADSFRDFTHGVRVLFLIHRSKEGADSANNDKLKKIVSLHREGFEKALYELLCMKHESEETLRIYSSVNPRDMEKSIRRFKYEQLDADYYDIDNRHAFYFDVKNRWIGALMKPSSADESNFIVDIDDKKELEDVLRVIAMADLNPNIRKSYATKNGWHIVMSPFNPALLGEHTPKIHKDALLLLSY